jgi:hypothetical protein
VSWRSQTVYDEWLVHRPSLGVEPSPPEVTEDEQHDEDDDDELNDAIHGIPPPVWVAGPRVAKVRRFQAAARVASRNRRVMKVCHLAQCQTRRSKVGRSGVRGGA